jgi:hypothetical protein
VVCLNTSGLSGRSPGSTPGQILGARAPLVVWRRRQVWEPESTTRALAWLSRWLGRAEDPVAAFHSILQEDGSSPLEGVSWAVQTSYRTWKTAPYQSVLRRGVPNLRLDRDHQKALARKHVEELVSSRTRRVMALAAYAAPGNSLSSLWEQLRDYLEGSMGHFAEIQWVRLQLPVDRSRLRHDLEEELKLQLRADPNERIDHLLRRHAPRVAGSGRRPVLWIDWGTCGTGNGPQARFTASQLADWVRFSGEFLSARCPDDLRLVSFLALEVEEASYKRVADALQKSRLQPWCRNPAFRLSDLPPLGKVAETDLLVFLEDPANASCDPGIQAEVAQRVIARTGGDFEQTVQLLEEAERGSWYDLLSRLQREQGMEAADDADEPF